MTGQRQHRVQIVNKAIAAIEAKLKRADKQAMPADLVRLLPIEKELDADKPCEVRMRWVKPAMSNSLTRT
jgi:hypothetical protein